MKHNGFLTIYILWLCAIVLTMSVAAAGLARIYVYNASHYAESVRLIYAAESIFLVEWDEFVTTPWRDVPRKRRSTITDRLDMAGPGHTVDRMITSDNPQALPFKGFLRIQVMNSDMQTKSCGGAFAVEQGETADEAIFTITQQEY